MRQAATDTIKLLAVIAAIAAGGFFVAGGCSLRKGIVAKIEATATYEIGVVQHDCTGKDQSEECRHCRAAFVELAVWEKKVAEAEEGLSAEETDQLHHLLEDLKQCPQH
jgi:hypothetical protein